MSAAHDKSPAATRAERLARALRENLKRRKDQARQRAAAAPADGPATDDGGCKPVDGESR